MAVRNIKTDAVFPTGNIALTVGVQDLMQHQGVDVVPYLRRHVQGDWGDIDDHDKRRNDAALKSGEQRLFSSYRLTPEISLWIITEWDRSATTLLLPDEY